MISGYAFRRHQEDMRGEVAPAELGETVAEDHQWPFTRLGEMELHPGDRDDRCRTSHLGS